MADGLSSANANLADSAATGTNAGWVQLHTGPPGTSGANNVSSTTTRQAVTWGSPSGGVITASSLPQWPAWTGTNNEVVTDISFWSAASSGTFGFSMQLGAAVTMSTGDTLTLASLSITLPTAS